jgi:hypothetical protein
VARRFVTLLVLLLAIASSSCRSTSSGTLVFRFDFTAGAQGWVAGFADHHPGDDAFLELTSDYRALPAPLGPGSALFISGNNHTDDLFMFFTREVRGLTPGARYRVTSDVRFATNVPQGCGGVGGSPGESVWLKAGASTTEPRTIVDGEGWLRLTADKGNQAVGGKDLVVLGTIENSRPCELSALVWEVKTLKSATGESEVTASPDGAVWLVAGTDSGFEATTSLFYTSIAITLEPTF